MLTARELDRLATVADPEVDRLVMSAMSANNPSADDPSGAPRTIEDEMVAMVRLGRSEGSSINDYFEAEIELPQWVDYDKLAVAQDFFRNWGLHLSVGLFFGALPRSYTAASAVRALTIAGGLTDEPARRIAETGQFLVDVMGMEENGLPLLPGTKGQNSARGVRLFHAIARQWLQADPDRWDAERDGIPIDQEEMLATVLLFSAAALDALDRMGIQYTPEQADAYVHAWCVVGELMGVGSVGVNALPLNHYDAWALATTIEARHCEDTPEGRRLADALLTEARENVPIGFGWLPRTMLHELASSEVAKTLDVDRGPAAAHLTLGCLRLANRMSFTLFRTTPFASAVAWAGRRIIKGYIAKERGGRPPWSFDRSLEGWRLRRRELATRKRSPHRGPTAVPANRRSIGPAAVTGGVPKGGVRESRAPESGMPEGGESPVGGASGETKPAHL